MLARNTIVVLLSLAGVAHGLQRTAPAIPGAARWSGGLGLPGTLGTVNAFALHDDGSGAKLYAAGDFQHMGSVPADDLARWNGSEWEAVPVPWTSYNRVEALASFDDGSGPRLFAAGYFYVPSLSISTVLMAWDGTRWEAFEASYSPTGFEGTTLLVDGSTLYLGGSFAMIDGVAARNVARLDASGWRPMGIGLETQVEALEVSAAQGLRRVYGGVKKHPPVTDTVFYWNGGVWVPVAGFQTPVHELRNVSDERGDRLLVASDDELVQLDGGGFRVVDDLAPARVYEMRVRQEGGKTVVYLGGGFLSASGIPAKGIVRWDGTTWSPLGAAAPTVDGTVNAILWADLDGDLQEEAYVGGSFRSVAGFTTTGVPAFSVARWDGSAWSSVGNDRGLYGSADAFAEFDDGTGPALYVGGQFFAAGSQPLYSVIRRRDGDWEPLPSFALNANCRIAAMQGWDDGRGPALYLGGDLFQSGFDGAVRWDGSTWESLGTGLLRTNGQTGFVSDFEVWDDGTGEALYATGTFDTADGLPARGIARWDGAAWTPLGDVVFGNALEVWDDGAGEELYVGGGFTSAGGVPANRLAAWNGLAWREVGLGTSGQVYALAAVDLDVLGGRRLVVGGGFFRVGNGINSRACAAWDGASWQALPTFGSVNALALLDDGRGPTLFSANSSRGLHALRPGGWETLSGPTAVAASALHASRLDPTRVELWMGVGGHGPVGGGVVSSGVARWSRSTRPTGLRGEPPVSWTGGAVRR